MTRRAGFVPVSLSAQEARIVASWFVREARHTRTAVPTLLGGGPDFKQRRAEQVHKLLEVAHFMVDSGRYKRKRVQMPREMASFIVHCWECHLIRARCIGGWCWISPALNRLANECRQATRGPGCPRLSRKLVQARITSGGGDVRELRRLKKRERRDVWLDQVTERGETLLSTSLQPPP